jgi:hypothetical protein
MSSPLTSSMYSGDSMVNLNYRNSSTNSNSNGITSPGIPRSQKASQISSQKLSELKEIHLHDWQQCDLNNECERIQVTGNYYLRKGNRLLFIGTCMQFSMLILSLCGSYVSAFTNMNSNEKSILMSVMNMTTAILSGVYTFFSFTKKGQAFKEASTILFTKIEKVKLAISTLKSDREYEDLKANIIETLIKYDTETIRDKFNHRIFIPVYREELKQGLTRKVIYTDSSRNSLKMIVKDTKTDEIINTNMIDNQDSESDSDSKKLEEL